MCLICTLFLAFFCLCWNEYGWRDIFVFAGQMTIDTILVSYYACTCVLKCDHWHVYIIPYKKLILSKAFKADKNSILYILSF